MPDSPIPDPQARKRELTRLRVRRHREKKVKQVAFVEALEAVAATEDGQKPSRARSQQALLKNVLVRRGVTIDRLVEKKVQMLDATKVRKIGEESIEVPDFATQARSCEALTRDLEAAGEYPSDAHGGHAAPITLNILLCEGMNSADALRKHREEMRLAGVVTVEPTGGETIENAVRTAESEQA